MSIEVAEFKLKEFPAGLYVNYNFSSLLSMK